MAAAGGPNIIDNGLVLYLDAASTKSFRGEPTENLVPTSGMRLCSEEFTRNSNHIESWTYSRETNIFGRANVTKITISPTGNNSQPYADWGFAAYKTGGSQIGDVYTVSFEFKVEEGDTRPNLVTTYANGYKTPDSSGAASLGTQYYEDLGDGWTRYSRTVTITTAGNTWWRFGMDSDNNNTTVYVDNFQIELKSYATRFVDGTRGTTVATGGGWADRTGNSNHGELVNGPTYSSNGLGAIVFDGVNDYIETSLITLLRANSTVSSWINIDDFTTGKSSTGRVFIRRTGFNFNSLVAFYDGGYSFESTTNSNPHELAGRTSGNISSTAITGGNWFHFALSFDSNTFYGYINGVQTGTAAVSSDLQFDRIGDGSGFSDSYPAYFKGTISMFKTYNRALTAAEVLQNYNATKGRYGL